MRRARGRGAAEKAVGRATRAARWVVRRAESMAFEWLSSGERVLLWEMNKLGANARAAMLLSAASEPRSAATSFLALSLVHHHHC